MTDDKLALGSGITLAAIHWDPDHAKMDRAKA
jgi:hypothetical protein